MTEQYCVRIQHATTQWCEFIVDAENKEDAEKQGWTMLENVDPYEDEASLLKQFHFGDKHKDIYVDQTYPMSEVSASVKALEGNQQVVGETEE